MNTPVEDPNFWLFDAVVAVWLLVGLLRGRKNGMSAELILLIKWLVLIVGCSYLYRYVGVVIREYSSISPEWCYRIAYFGIAFVIAIVFNKFQSLVGDKLLGNDFFGDGEYYLGMASGVVRFACMIVFLLAFISARIPTPEEVKQFNSRTQDLGPAQVNPLKIQRQIIVDSHTGRFVRANLPQLLIVLPTAPAPEPAKPAETIAIRKQRMVDDIVGSPK